ncbi:MAG: thiol oxidoreductase [Rickettsiales bacterium]|nr:thiol oxidoreductase [Rickettsiales bacterium]
MSRAALLTLAWLLVVGCGGRQLVSTAAEAVGELSGWQAWALAGGSATVFDDSPNAYALALRTLDPASRRGFAVGNAFFNDNWVAAPASTLGRDGLGPLFNAPSCSTCHLRDGRSRMPSGPERTLQTAVILLSVPGADGQTLVPHPVYGEQLQPKALPGIPAEVDPRVSWLEQAGQFDDGSPFSLRSPQLQLRSLGYGPLPAQARLSLRVAPAVFGLGLLEAVPKQDIIAWADPEDRNQDGISGRPRQLWDHSTGQQRLGRFGWKARNASLRQQAAGAFSEDIGISSPLHPREVPTAAQELAMQAASGGSPEVDDHKLDRVALYLKGLAVPARKVADLEQLEAGSELFAALGCAACHRPSMRTRSDAEPAALADQLIWPYTDLLLHDMGEGLADHKPSGNASGREWRTPPLWGLRLLPVVSGHEQLLHDGRARNVEEAILWHGGEAEAAQRAYRALPAADRTTLLAFLRQL